MAKYYFKGNSSAMLNSYLQKSIKNRLRRWDFCTPVSLSDGQRSKCADLAELLLFILSKMPLNFHYKAEKVGLYPL